MARRQKQISVTVDELHLQSLARMSEESGRSPAEIAREALHRYLWTNDATFRAEKQRRIDSITRANRVKDEDSEEDGAQ
jgi:hypothetical protein